MSEKKNLEGSGSKEQIVKAAIEEFYEYGLHGARVDRIANRSGFNKAMIYYHYKNKEELYQAVLENIFGQILIRVEGAILDPNQSFEEKLKAAIGIYMDFFSKNPKLPRIVFGEVVSGGRHFRSFFAKNVRPISQFLQNVLKDESEKGNVRKDDHRFAIIPIIAPVILYFLANPLLESIVDLDLKDPSTIERYRNYLFNALYYGLKSREIQKEGE